jgi:predicted nucleic acid-binding protein
VISVVDSSVLIDLLRGHEPALQALEHAAADTELWGVVVCRTEVIAGMRPRERSSTMALLDGLTWLDVDPPLADAAGELARRFHTAHSGIDVVDYLVAAAVRRLEARLLTTNVRHFPMLAGLRPAY